MEEEYEVSNNKKLIDEYLNMRSLSAEGNAYDKIDGILGRLVIIKRTFLNETLGEEISIKPAMLAVDDILNNPLNGTLYKSAIILWEDVISRDWDTSV